MQGDFASPMSLTTKTPAGGRVMMLESDGPCDNCGDERHLTEWIATRPNNWPEDQPFMICHSCQRSVMTNIARAQGRESHDS